MEEKVNIELRSEKVRNIISNEMPFFIRYGISIIVVILAVVALGVWLHYNNGGIELESSSPLL